MSTAISTQWLGRPLGEVADALHERGLLYSFSETEKDSRHYIVALQHQYVVRVCIDNQSIVTCAKQVYSDEVNSYISKQYGEQYVVKA